MPELGRGFVSDGQTSTVTIFNLKTLETIGQVPTGKKPDGIIFDSATSQVLAFNGGSNSVTVISAADGKVAGTVDLGGGPEFAVADGKGHVFNNLEDQNQVVQIYSKKLGAEQRVSPPPGPTSTAMTAQPRFIVAEQGDGCGRCGPGKVITTVLIGDHVDATAFDPDSRLIFNSNGRHDHGGSSGYSGQILGRGDHQDFTQSEDNGV